MSKKSENSDMPIIRDNVEVMWEELPGHFGGALSKLIATPENAPTNILTFGYLHINQRDLLKSIVTR